MRGYFFSNKYLGRSDKGLIKKAKREKADLYVVKSLTMMNYLAQKGFPVVKVEDAKDNPMFKVFLFENTKHLQEVVNNYFTNT